MARLGGKLMIPIVLSNQGGMVSANRARAIGRNVHQLWSPELLRKQDQNAQRHRCRIGQKGPEKANGTELEGQAELGDGSSCLGNELTIAIIQVEEPGKLLGGGISNIVAILLALRVSEEINRHEAAPTPRHCFLWELSFLQE